jgi:hypothetical protein
MKHPIVHVVGTSLAADQQKQALNSYVHRFTKDHKPIWATKPMPDGRAYPVQFASDKDWLANTTFPTRNGKLVSGKNSDCHSTQTWPDNPELRKNAP